MSDDWNRFRKWFALLKSREQLDFIDRAKKRTEFNSHNWLMYFQYLEETGQRKPQQLLDGEAYDAAMAAMDAMREIENDQASR